jgi:hypothetical protein
MQLSRHATANKTQEAPIFAKDGRVGIQKERLALRATTDLENPARNMDEPVPDLKDRRLKQGKLKN